MCYENMCIYLHYSEHHRILFIGTIQSVFRENTPSLFVETGNVPVTSRCVLTYMYILYVNTVCMHTHII
jgi:hypothetical protein